LPWNLCSASRGNPAQLPAEYALDRWNAWVQVCDLAPMKRLAKTIMAKSEGILRSIATGLSNGVLEAINGNVQAAKRKAKGYRTKRNLKAIVYLIAGDVLANSPI
jgi:transposase